MDALLKKLLDVSGISGYESEVAALMSHELKKTCDEVCIDSFGNVIARKGKSGTKIMLAAHMDEIGFVVKHISKEGFIWFVKVGGIDDRILLGQRVVIASKQGEIRGVIGAKPPHLLKEEERRKLARHEDMFIDIGCSSKEEVLRKVSIGDPIVFEPNSGDLNGRLCYGKAVDNRVGCYALLKIMQKLKKVHAQVYAVATAQEEVGLKGARTSSFRIAPDFALVLDTGVSGDTPQTAEKESALKLSGGVAITVVEAGGRGLIVNGRVKDLLIETAQRNKIKYQIDVVDGGMTDGATIYMNREGVLTGVLAIPTRYVHSPNGVFSAADVKATIDLAVKVIERKAAEK